MEKKLSLYIDSIDEELYEDRFLNLFQNIFCYKYKISEDTYNELRGYLPFQNKFYITDHKVFDESLKKIELHQIVLNFDDYLDVETRKKTGSFYTPSKLAESMTRRAIADYILKTTGNVKFEKAILLSSNNLSEKDLIELKECVNHIDLIDISSGTGVFIFKALEILYRVNNFKKEILLDIVNNLYAVDLQSKPLEIFMIIIYDYLLENGIEIIDLPKLNILCEDSLLYKKPFDKKFEIVLGNPPYIGEKGNKDLFELYKNDENLCNYYEGKMDLFYFFIYKGIEILKPDGILSYITTNYFVTADGAKKLREFLKKNIYFLRIINFDECKLFSNAKGMHNLIFNITNSKSEDVKIHYIDKTYKNFDEKDIYNEKYIVKQNEVFSEDGNMLVYESKEYFSIIKKILEKSQYRLGDIASINQGIVSGADKVTKSMLSKKFTEDTIIKNNIELDQGIYIHNKGELKSEFLKPFYKNSDIFKYFIRDTYDKEILYINNKEIHEDSFEWSYLNKFYQVLSQRREVKTKSKSWYALQWGRDENIFRSEKIVAPQRAIKNLFAYSDNEFYSSADIYYINKVNINIKYLLGVLNSKFMYFWLYNRGKRKGKQLELYSKPLSQIPILVMNDSDEKEVISIIDSFLCNKEVDKEKEQIINNKIYKYYRFDKREIELIESIDI